MSSEWKDVTLKSITSILGDGLHGTPEYDANGNYSFINGNNLREGRIVIDEKTKRVSLAEFEKHKKNLNDRTILVSINGTLGNVALYGGEKVILGKSACYFNVLPEVDKHFIQYVVTSELFQKYIDSLATGSTIKNVSLKLMRDFSFKLPPANIQQAISAFLKALDDRITLLRETNATLEAIAQALFKSWFVDFDPVHARQQGREPIGMDEATAALFPDRFEESELGLVPKGWTVDRLDERIDILNGFAFKSDDYAEDGIFVLRTRNFDDGKVFRYQDDVYLPLSFVETYNKYLCQDFDYHLVMVGASVGKRGMIFPHQLPALRNQNMWCFRAKNQELSQPFVKFLLDSIVARSLGLASGSAREFFRKGDFGSQKLLFPNEKVLVAFNDFVEVCFNQQSVNLSKIDILTTLRDTLLPRLISGQLRLPEAETLLTEAIA
jgi:type I restriction enzyme S subunit